MQTPAGYEMRDGIAYPLDWLAIIFNPSFPYRFFHMLTAAYLTTAFVVLAVGARYLVAGRHEEDARTMVRMAIGMIAVLAPLQLFLGDQHGLNTLKHQPMKIAAIEAHWDGSKPGDFEIFAWPDEKAEINRFAISIPRGSSLILTHESERPIPRLERRAARSAPASAAAILRLPHHGRHRFPDDRHRALWRIPVVARQAHDNTLVSANRAIRLVARLRRGARRLDHHRNRAPALDRHRHPAHSRRDLAGLGRERAHDARAVRRRLRHRVCDGHLLHQPADRAWPAGQGCRSTQPDWQPALLRRRRGARSDTGG